MNLGTGRFASGRSCDINFLHKKNTEIFCGLVQSICLCVL